MTARFTIIGGPAFYAEHRFGQHGLSCNVSYVCPRCGSLWAQLHNGGYGWRPFARVCPVCPSDNLSVPGSLLLPWEEHDLDGLPADMLARELLLHLTHYQKLGYAN